MCKLLYAKNGIYDYVSSFNTCITVSCMKYIDDKMIDLNKGKAPEKYKIKKKKMEK